MKNVKFRAFKAVSFILALFLAGGLAPIQAVAADAEIASTIVKDFRSMAVKKDGTLWAWGWVNNNTKSAKPVKIMDGVAFVVEGSFHSMAVKKDGSLWAWGNGTNGDRILGGGTTSDSSTPIKILDNVVSVSAKGDNTFAIKKDGTLWAWGRNHNDRQNGGRLGDGTATTRLSPVKIMDNVASVTAGSDNSFAITKDGVLWGWGDNSWGQLGDGTKKNRLKPVKIMDNAACVSVSAASNFTMAIKKDGTLWAWGDNGGTGTRYGGNTDGRLGDGTTTERLKPYEIMDNVASVSMDSYTLAVKKDGTLWSWGGSNSWNVLGDNRQADPYNPASLNTPVKIMDNVATARAVKSNPYAIKKDGSLWTWGANREGELGDGGKTSPFESRSNPIKILDNVASVSGSTLAVKKDGSLWTWGYNDGIGSLGDGTTKDRLKPVKIMDGVALPKSSSKASTASEKGEK